MTKILAISIPSYNREALLLATAKSIVDEIISSDLKSEVKIYVFDNSSTDNTVASLDKYFRTTSVDYEIICSETNLGAEGNFDRCCRYPSEKYSWIFGSDDLIKAGSLSSVIDFLVDSNPLSGVSVDYSLMYDKNLTNFKLFTPTFARKTKYISCLDNQPVNLLSNSYIQSISTLFLGYFPFISSTIVNTASYKKLIPTPLFKNREGYDFIPWFYLLLRNFGWHYIPVSAIICRRDSTNQDDASGFYGKNSENAFRVNRALLRIMRSCTSSALNEKQSDYLISQFILRYFLGDLIRLKLNPTADYKNTLSQYFSEIYSYYHLPHETTKFMVTLGISTPSLIYRLLKTVYRVLVKRY